MHTEEWNGARVAAVLALLKDAGYSQSRMAALAEVGDRSTVNRWSRGENRPGPDAVRRLAVAIWPRYPKLARELTEASGYPWAEPQSPPVDVLAEVWGQEIADSVRAEVRKRAPKNAEAILRGIEDDLIRPSSAASSAHPGAAAG